jgi:hypothetical protein
MALLNNSSVPNFKHQRLEIERKKKVPFPLRSQSYEFFHVEVGRGERKQDSGNFFFLEIE